METRHTFAGWSSVANLTYGGIGLFDDAVFVTDMKTYGDPADEANGIVRFDLSDFSATRFADGQDYQDLCIGLDGLLYALPGGSPSGRVDVYDPLTKAFVRSVNFTGELATADIRGVAVDVDGLIYTAGFDGKIYQVSVAGAPIKSLSTGYSLADIDIDTSGHLVAGESWNRTVITSDTSLAGFNSFLVTVGTSYTVHVAFTEDAPPPDGGQAQTALFRVSENALGVQANGSSYNAALSDDARLVAFESDASNLVAGDSNGFRDIFVKDMVSGAMTRASTDTTGLQANGASFNASISADGRYVVFESDATNLVAGDSNGWRDIFRKDLGSGNISRVSAGFSGAQANGASFNASISADGRYVVFESDANNLVAGDSNGQRDIFIKDMMTGALQLLSAEATGLQANGSSYLASISADGDEVVYQSWASNLAAGDSNYSSDVFAVSNGLMLTGNGFDTVQASVSYTLPEHIEALQLVGTAATHGTGNALDNALTGNSAANFLDGGLGNDQLIGGAGNDELVGGMGADTMQGGPGSDLYHVADANDEATELADDDGTGRDPSLFDDTLAHRLEQFYIAYYGRAADYGGLAYWKTTLTTVLNNQQIKMCGYFGNPLQVEFANLYGTGNSNDVFLTNVYLNLFNRAPDAGGLAYWIGVINQKVAEGYYLDDARAQVVIWVLDGAQKTDAELIATKTENAVALSKVITEYDTAHDYENAANAAVFAEAREWLSTVGSALPDEAFGALPYKLAVEEILGPVVGDTVISGLVWSLGANFENLILGGSDSIDGAGNALDNRLTGNAAANMLTGGGGQDAFMFSAPLGMGNIDVIADFSVADDTICLDGAIFTALGGGGLAEEAFHVGTSAANAADRIIYDNTTGALYYDVDGTGPTPELQFAVVTTGLALTSADFWVF